MHSNHFLSPPSLISLPLLYLHHFLFLTYNLWGFGCECVCVSVWPNYFSQGSLCEHWIWIIHWSLVDTQLKSMTIPFPEPISAVSGRASKFFFHLCLNWYTYSACIWNYSELMVTMVMSCPEDVFFSSSFPCFSPIKLCQLALLQFPKQKEHSINTLFREEQSTISGGIR